MQKHPKICQECMHLKLYGLVGLYAITVIPFNSKHHQLASHLTYLCSDIDIRAEVGETLIQPCPKFEVILPGHDHTYLRKVAVQNKTCFTKGQNRNGRLNTIYESTKEMVPYRYIWQFSVSRRLVLYLDTDIRIYERSLQCAVHQK